VNCSSRPSNAVTRHPYASSLPARRVLSAVHSQTRSSDTLAGPYGPRRIPVHPTHHKLSHVQSLTARLASSHAQEGSILLDGQPISSFSRGEWAKAVALVSQDPVLFSGTIADNIAYGASVTASHPTSTLMACAQQ
jgi:ABC-type transport system involved in Fe-S cluster assembly fused permease/ATPase subunit